MSGGVQSGEKVFPPTATKALSLIEPSRAVSMSALAAVFRFGTILRVMQLKLKFI